MIEIGYHANCPNFINPNRIAGHVHLHPDVVKDHAETDTLKVESRNAAGSRRMAGR
jgi:hypothetical protein